MLCVFLIGAVFLLDGCARGRQPNLAGTILRVEDPAFLTQMLRPGVTASACDTRFAWQAGDVVGSIALEQALEAVPDATVLRNARVEVRCIHLGLFVVECAEVRGDAARDITQIALPSLGHDHH